MAYEDKYAFDVILKQQ